MSLPLRPIFSALLRNRTGALLVALQVAIALAVLVNAVYIVKQRVDRIGRPTGLDIPNQFVLTSRGFGPNYNERATIEEDLAYLRGVAGVLAATAINSIPLSGSGSATGIDTVPNERASGKLGNYFEIDEQGLAALGVRLIAGRNFRHDEILPQLDKGQRSAFVPEVILTREFAEALFPGRNALGATIYGENNEPATVIGIVDLMQGTWSYSPLEDYVFFEPRIAYTWGGDMNYLVRTRPGQRDAIMRQVEEHLSSSNPNRVIESIHSMQQYKNDAYRADRNMAIYLVTVTVLMVAITCLGIFGLATFNVSTRTKQIGTRRAVGARRRDIVRYFMVENGLITSGGVLVGCALALGVGYWLSLTYQLPRLDLYYLVGGIVALWTVGQLAAWQPARRAARISPSIATRTV